MEIWRKDNERKRNSDKNSLFISKERPILFTNKNEEYDIKNSWLDSFDKEYIEKISSFYDNYSLGYNTTEKNKISIRYIENYLRLKAVILTLNLDNKIIGSMVSFIIPIKIKTELNKNSIETTFKSFIEDSLFFCCATFLNLDRKYRKKGLGMCLIQESLQTGYDHGCLASYFINTISRCSNSVQFFYWYFPLNLDKLDSCNFPYPKNYKNLFIIKEMKNIFRVNSYNIIDALKFYKKETEDKKIYFSPTLDYFKIWIEIFPTYIVVNEGNITGLFSFNIRNTYYPMTNNEIFTGYLITCIGKQPETLVSSLFIAKTLSDVLYLYEIGNLSASLLSSVNAQRSNKGFINFYNIKISLKSEDIYFTLL